MKTLVGLIVSEILGAVAACAQLFSSTAYLAGTQKPQIASKKMTLLRSPLILPLADPPRVSMRPFGRSGDLTGRSRLRGSGDVPTDR